MREPDSVFGNLDLVLLTCQPIKQSHSLLQPRLGWLNDTSSARSATVRIVLCGFIKIAVRQGWVQDRAAVVSEVGRLDAAWDRVEAVEEEDGHVQAQSLQPVLVFTNRKKSKMALPVGVGSPFLPWHPEHGTSAICTAPPITLGSWVPVPLHFPHLSHKSSTVNCAFAIHEVLSSHLYVRENQFSKFAITFNDDDLWHLAFSAHGTEYATCHQLVAPATIRGRSQRS
jgi:hypothetical protein